MPDFGSIDPTSVVAETESPALKKRGFFFLKVMAGLFLFVVGGVLVFQFLLAPWIVRYALGSLITKPCRHCTLEIQTVHINLFGPTVSLDEVKFSAQAGSATKIFAHIPHLVAEMYPLALLKKKLHLGPIRLVHPAVNVVESDQPNPPLLQTSAAVGESRVTTVEFGGISVVGGDFMYVHEKEDIPAAVRVHQIDLSIDRLGNTPELVTERARGVANGVLEHSGKFTLTVAPVLFAESPDVDVDLKIAGQDLPDLNAFFMHEDGISLKGVLIDGQSHVEIRHPNAHSVVRATFKDLEFKVNKTKRRSAFEAFFSGLLAGAKLGSHNLYDTPEERTQAIDAKREADETLIAFILRAMKEAALKVPSREGKAAFDAKASNTPVEDDVF